MAPRLFNTNLFHPLNVCRRRSQFVRVHKPKRDVRLRHHLDVSELFWKEVLSLEFSEFPIEMVSSGRNRCALANALQCFVTIFAHGHENRLHKPIEKLVSPAARGRNPQEQDKIERERNANNSQHDCHGRTVAGACCAAQPGTKKSTDARLPRFQRLEIFGAMPACLRHTRCRWTAFHGTLGGLHRLSWHAPGFSLLLLARLPENTLCKYVSTTQSQVPHFSYSLWPHQLAQTSRQLPFMTRASSSPRMPTWSSTQLRWMRRFPTRL